MGAQDNMTKEDNPRLPPDKFMLLKHEIRIRGLYPNGMTVKQLITELKRYRPECKVIMYDHMGFIYPVTYTLLDSANKVAVI